MDELAQLAQQIRVDASGVQDCTPGHQWGPAVRPYYLIHLIFSGRGTFEAGGRKYALGPNQGFIIYPGALTVYRADESAPWSYGWMGYSGDLAPMLTRKAGLKRENPVFSLENAEALRALILGAERDMASLRMGMAGAAGGLLRFLAHIGQNAPEAPSDDPADDYFQRAQWYIQANLDHGVGVADVARFVGLCRSQLFRVFRAAAGCSPRQWIAQCRLSRAQSLLSDSHLSLEEIARSCGYAGAAQLGQSFRRLTGQSPGAFRRRK